MFTRGGLLQTDLKKALQEKEKGNQHFKNKAFREAIREAQALEGLGRPSEALEEIKKLLSIDSKNREANEMAMRLTVKLMKDSDRM